MGSESIVQGRLIGSKELESIRLLLTENPYWSAGGFPARCASCGIGVLPNGQMKDMAARTLLLKLEERGCLQLPLKRQTAASRMRQTLASRNIVLLPGGISAGERVRLFRSVCSGRGLRSSVNSRCLPLA